MGYTDSIIIIQVLETLKEIRTNEHFMKFGLKYDFFTLENIDNIKAIIFSFSSIYM